MKNLHVAALATLFGISAASGILVTQAQHPGNDSGLLASTASIASADQDDRGKDRGKHGNRNNGNWQYNQNGQCNPNGNTRRGDGERDDQGDRDDQGERDDQGNRGQHRGWQNPNNPHYNCNPNGGGYGQQGNAVIRGTIVGVNGNQVRLMEGFGQFITIDDQPALNNQQTGRVVVGRYVTAYGYYQNGIFYATSMQ